MAGYHHNAFLDLPVNVSSLSILALFLSIVSCLSEADRASQSIEESTRNIFVTSQRLHQQLTIDSSILLIKVGYGPPSGEFIPNSIYLNTDEFEYDHFEIRARTSVTRTTTVEHDSAKGLTIHDTLPRNYWNLYPDSLLFRALAFAGITSSSLITVYADVPEAASRLVWCLLYAGVDSVQMLNGGLKSWQNAGFNVGQEAKSRRPASSFGPHSIGKRNYRNTTNAIREIIEKQDSAFVIIDVRSYREFQGDTSIYAYIPRRGRIAGARFGGSEGGNIGMADYYDSHGQLTARADFIALFESIGISADKTITFYCGTGWRSSLAWLLAYDMGWDNINNYDGSWYEWSMGPDSNINPMMLGNEHRPSR